MAQIACVFEREAGSPLAWTIYACAINAVNKRANGVTKRSFFMVSSLGCFRYGFPLNTNAKAAVVVSPAARVAGLKLIVPMRYLAFLTVMFLVTWAAAL